jgi:hypothetical protein
MLPGAAVAHELPVTVGEGRVGGVAGAGVAGVACQPVPARRHTQGFSQRQWQELHHHMPPAFATQLSAQLYRLPVLGTCMSASSWCVQGSLRAVIGSNGITALVLSAG